MSCLSKNVGMTQLPQSRKLTEADRETIRQELVSIAERIRREYGLKIATVKSVMREMLDVSV